MYEDLDFRNSSLSLKDVVAIAATLAALGAAIHFGGLPVVTAIGGIAIGFVCAKIF